MALALVLMASLCGRAKEAPLMVPFACSVVRMDTRPVNAHKLTPTKANLSCVTGRTRFSLSPIHPLSPSLTTANAPPQNMVPKSSISVLSAEVAHTTPQDIRVERVVDHIITPYNADAYKDFPSCFNLTEKCPDLIFNLQNGFTIGDMPSFSRTYTPPDHNSALEHPEIIQDYLSKEVSFSHMSGPYTHSQAKHKLSGHFISCPLGLVEKAGEPGGYHIIQDLSYNNKEDNYLVNSFLDANDFPTEWGTASQVAEIVSFVCTFFFEHIYALRCTFHIFSCTFCTAFSMILSCTFCVLSSLE